MQRVARRGVQWLTLAAEDPEDCRLAWHNDPRSPYLLPVGRDFDLVATDQKVGMEAFDQMRRRGMPLGPVMVDWAARKMGFFLPPRSRDQFAGTLMRETQSPPEHRYLTTGSFVVVPGPLTLSHDRYEWLNPPAHELNSSPHQSMALAVMLAASATFIECAERYGEVAADVR
ncbi:bifunctional DNA primase/polymerase [Streptomyces sp. HPF1205]|uniref:bifunctional DNA primase/polymerase n=1 Tax=Streptomyces sp. HPF1205 TaxID=2873262 RepID=UPI001CEDE571|nr:bifunctional DNA primase/polymerase [Streptomyces sp. HPF1205]